MPHQPWAGPVWRLAAAGAVALAMLVPPPPAARAAAGASPSAAQQAASANVGPSGRPSWRYAGIDLAARGDGESSGGGGVLLSPEELDAEARAALNRYADERVQKQIKRATQPSKGGKLVRNPLASRVPDPSLVPSNEEIKKMALQSAWRPDKLKDMTYTQFWALVKERQVDTVRYSDDRRSVFVTTKASAPGGARTEKVGLPFDPDLFDHMVEHG
jgi:hypothetical protein